MTAPTAELAHPATGIIFRVCKPDEPASHFPARHWLSEPPRDRFDDPRRRCTTLYGAERLTTALLETLATLRPDIPIVLRQRSLGADPEELPPRVTLRWQSQRVYVRLQLAAPRPLLDLTAASTRTFLRLELAQALQDLDLVELDLSVITSQERRLTQRIAAWALHNGYCGIRYPSRFDGHPCWAVFHRPTVQVRELAQVSLLHRPQALYAAARQHGLVVERPVA